MAEVKPRPAPPDAVALRVCEAAYLLGLSTTTVHRLIARGDLPAVRLPGGRNVVRVPRHRLEAWLDALDPAAAPPAASSSEADQ